MSCQYSCPNVYCTLCCPLSNCCRLSTVLSSLSQVEAVGDAGTPVQREAGQGAPSGGSGEKIRNILNIYILRFIFGAPCSMYMLYFTCLLASSHVPCSVLLILCSTLCSYRSRTSSRAPLNRSRSLMIFLVSCAANALYFMFFSLFPDPVPCSAL